MLDEDLPGLQLVIVFDGVDLSGSRGWAADPRVRIIRNEQSLGPAAAMTSAIAIAETPYVARLDSDDRDLPGRLARQVAFLDDNPGVVAVSSRTTRIDEEGRQQGDVKLPAGPDIRRHLLLSNVVPHSTLTFRRDAARRVGGYNAAFRQMEDYDFILRLAALGPIAQMSDPLVEYRVHSGQTSRGAAPSGPHIAAIAAGRRALAHSLGVGQLRWRAEHLAWVFAQHLRWHGLRRPGHER